MSDSGMTDDEKQIAKLSMQIEIDRAKAKVNEHRKFALEYKKKSSEHEANIPIAEKHVQDLEEKIKQLE